MTFKNISLCALLLVSSLVVQAQNIGTSAPNPQIGQILQQAPNLQKNILTLGLAAFNHAKEEGMPVKDVLTIIDYSKPSFEKRFFVIDLDNSKVLFDTYVAHGKSSGDVYASHFSNQARSDASSLGVYLTGNTYMGKHGYSLRLYGLEKGINDNLYKRTVVIHPAWYVDPSFLQQHGRLGRSWGCPALSEEDSQPIIQTIKDNSIILAYYPDQNWLSHSTFLSA